MMKREDTVNIFDKSNQTIKKIGFIDISNFSDLFNIDDEYANAVEKLKPLVHAKRFEIMNKFYDFLESKNNLAAFFTDDNHVSSVKSKTMSYLSFVFNTNFNKDFFKTHARVGFIHFKIGLDEVYYESSMHHLEKAILDATSSSSPEDTLAYSKAISKAVSIAKYITLRAYHYYTYRFLEIMEENHTELLKSIYHSTSNQVAVIDGVLKFLKNKPERLEKELERLEGIKNKIKTDVLYSKELIAAKHNIQKTYELKPRKMSDILHKTSDMMSYRLVEKNISLQGGNVSPETTILTNDLIFIYLVLTNVLSEIIFLSEKNTSIHIEVDDENENSKYLSVIILANPFKGFEDDYFSFNLNLVEDFARRISATCEFFDFSDVPASTLQKNENFAPVALIKIPKAESSKAENSKA